MKQNKRFYSFLLALVMLFSLLPQLSTDASAETHSGSCGENLTWTLDTETGLLTISGEGSMDSMWSSWSDISIGNPWNKYRSSIREVVIDEGVDRIGSGAFYDCDSLTNVTIPSSVMYIGDGAFYDCDSLTNVTIPDGVEKIGYEAFSYCDNLMNVTIPASVTYIHGDSEGAFFCCSSLQTILVSDQNEYYCSEDGVLFNKEKSNLIQCPGGKTGAYTIPDSVTHVDSNAFEGCKDLNSILVSDRNEYYSSEDGVLFDKGKNSLIAFPGGKGGAYTVPNSVTSIYQYAFVDCSRLTSVTIPSNVRNVGYSYKGNPFQGCTALLDISVSPNNDFYYSEDGVLFNKGKSTLIAFPGGKSGAYTIPDGVEEIDCGAFRDCSNLTSVTIPDSVTEIDDFAFRGCSNLASVTIPDSVNEIASCAFYSCTSLASATIPDSVTRIYEGTFYGCTSLASMTIPNSVTNISWSAFSGCSSLERVTILNPQCDIENGNNTLGDHDTTVIYGYADSTAQSYAEWYGYTFVVFDGCEYGYHRYEVVEEKVHTQTTGGWRKLRCVDCGDEITEQIPAGHVFEPVGGSYWIKAEKCIYCDESHDEDISQPIELDTLTNVEIPDDYYKAWLKYTPEQDGTYILTSFSGADTYAELYESDGNWINENDDDGEGWNFLISTYLYAGQTYYYCVRFLSDDSGSIPVELALKTIPTSGECGENLSWRFDEETGILTITGSGSMYDYYWNDSAPWDDISEKITGVALSDGLTRIGDYAFSGCTALDDVVIPGSVETVGNDAFRNCSSLTNLTIQDGVANIDEYAFTRSGLQTVTIPQSVKYIGEAAFRSCYDLYAVTIESTDCEIEDYNNYSSDYYETANTLGDSYQVTVYGYEGSSAQRYAEDFDYPFTVIGSGECGESHIFGPWTQTAAPTCTDKGQEQQTCSRCGKVQTRSIDALGHDWDEGVVTEEPTAKKDGIITYTCLRCGKTKTESFSYVPDNPGETENPEQEKTALEKAIQAAEKLNPDDYTEAAAAKLAKAIQDAKNALKTAETPEDIAAAAKELKDVVDHLEKKPSGSKDDPDKTDKPTAPGKTDKPTAPGKTDKPGKTNDKPAPSAATNFVDVPAKAFYAQAVAWAVEKGVTNGIDKTHFGPDQGCTRGQVVTFLWRTAGSPEPKNKTNPFADVKNSAFYYKAVLWAVENKITNGMSATTFCPDATCTRGQIVTFLWRANGSSKAVTVKNPFQDVSKTAFYYPAMLWAVEYGVTTGTSPTTFAPGDTCTRGQVVTFLYRASQKSTGSEFKAANYEIVLSTDSWETALANARKKGGKLVSFDSQDEYRFVLGLIEKSGKIDNIFCSLGARRDMDGKDYYWVDANNKFYGKPLNGGGTWCADCWEPGEPNLVYNGRQEPIVIMYYSAAEARWVWYDGSGTYRNPKRTFAYIIEYDK